MEKRYLTMLRDTGGLDQISRGTIIYADPFDLTKMLDVKPGTKTLPGVSAMQRLFYSSGRTE